MNTRYVVIVMVAGYEFRSEDMCEAAADECIRQFKLRSPDSRPRKEELR